MNTHKNARLTFVRRVELAQRALAADANHSRLGREFGVSRQTVRKWHDRYVAGGREALRDRSSRPHRSPHRLRRYQRRQIARCRRRHWSSLRIAQHYGLKLSTVVAVQRRLGLNRLERLDPPRPIVRYERRRPGTLVHLDSKQFGRIVRPGHRVTGARRSRVRRGGRGIAGWEHLHVAIDDCTRLTYAEMLPTNDGAASAGFLTRALAWFLAQGIRVRRLLTDNGGAYLSRAFATVVRGHRLTHKRTRPFRPQTNGKAERVIRTLTYEWAYAQAYSTSACRSAALAPYLQYYNTERHHTALGFSTPAERLLARL